MYIEKLCNKLITDNRQQRHLSSPRNLNHDIDRLKDDGLQECERASYAIRSNLCVVCNEKYKKAKAANPEFQYKDLPKKQKQFIGAICMQSLPVHRTTRLQLLERLSFKGPILAIRYVYT